LQPAAPLNFCFSSRCCTKSFKCSLTTSSLNHYQSLTPPRALPKTDRRVSVYQKPRRPKYDGISDSYGGYDGLSYQIIQSKLRYLTSLFSVSRHFSPAVWHESQVCYHSATQSSQFDVSFPKKLLKFVGTRGNIFSLNSQITVWRPGSARPDPLGELKRSPRHPSRNKRGLLLRGGGGRGRKGGGEWRREGNIKGEEGRGGGKKRRGRPLA